MREKTKKGFSVIELVVVIALVIIVGLPIIQGIIQSIKFNSHAQALRDATILAQKYSETIETQGLGGIAGLTLGVDYDVSLNNFDYVVKCTEQTSTIIDTATVMPEGYKEYFKFDSSTADTLTITKEEIQADGSSNIIMTLSDLNITGDNYSLVFCNDSGINKIKIYRNDQYNTDPSVAVKKEFSQYISEVITDWRSIRLVNTDAGRTVNVNIYNTLSDNVNVFYNSSQNVQIKFKYDRNVIRHDLFNLNSITFDANREALTYKIEVRKKNDTEILASRLVTYIE